MKHSLIIAAMSLFSLFSRAGEGEQVKPYPAPKVEAVDQDGKTVKLADIYKKGLVLVYFYPKADTPGCTKQACSLRDAYEDLTKHGITIVNARWSWWSRAAAISSSHSEPWVTGVMSGGTSGG